jgi:hypothetical protein
MVDVPKMFVALLRGAVPVVPAPAGAADASPQINRRVLSLVLCLAGALSACLASATPASARACTVPPNRDIDVTRAVYRAGTGLGVSPRVMLAGFEAGWVESHMNNLACGDKDSLGVFQQRPSQGWGTPEQIMNVDYSATQFFTRAVRSGDRNPGWTSGQIAQDVQKSGFPARYDQVEMTARNLLAEVSPPDAPTSTAGVRSIRWGDEIHVFATGVDARVHQIVWRPGGDWSGWFDLGGQVVGAPQPFVYNNEVHIFATGVDARVHQKVWRPGGDWSGWFDLGGQVVGAPQPFAYNNEIHIFATGVDARVHQKVWRPGGDWSGWFDLGGQVVGAPQPFAYNNEVHVFATGVDARVHQKVWRPGGDWSGWFDLGGQVVGAPQPFAYNNEVHIFATGVDARVHQKVWRPGGDWSGWIDHEGAVVGPPEILIRDAEIHVFVTGTDQHLHQKVWNPAAGWTGWIDHLGLLVK